MLSIKNYPQSYVDTRRAVVKSQVAAYRKAAKAGDTKSLESAYFTNMVLALDMAFIHRMRGNEGKDGNPLNEVRLLSYSLLENDGVFALPDKSIKWDPDRSVLGFDTGKKIVIDDAAFVDLAEAFFDEIEKRFV